MHLKIIVQIVVAAKKPTALLMLVLVEEVSCYVHDDVETTNDDINDELLKKKWIDAINMCINTTNMYTLEDLENLLKIKQ
ncbi:16546_t:CDS:2, partial [Cetraspora pellucida]